MDGPWVEAAYAADGTKFFDMFFQAVAPVVHALVPNRALHVAVLQRLASQDRETCMGLVFDQAALRDHIVAEAAALQ